MYALCHETTINDRRIDTNNIYRAVSSPDKSAKLRYELSLSAATSNETHARSTRRDIKRDRVDIDRSQIERRKYLVTIYEDSEEIKDAERDIVSESIVRDFVSLLIFRNYDFLDNFE